MKLVCVPAVLVCERESCTCPPKNMFLFFLDVQKAPSKVRTGQIKTVKRGFEDTGTKASLLKC